MKNLAHLIINGSSDVSTKHPGFSDKLASWVKIRDCIDGEDKIKSKKEIYLPRPSGMSGEYADAYDSYIERAHFPLVTGYALSGALGVVVTKLPEFNVPKKLEYILKNSTKDGRSISQLFLDMIIEIFQTGRCPIVVDIVPKNNQFKFVQYKAEQFINWKVSTQESEKNLTLAVFEEKRFENDDAFSHSSNEIYRVMCFKDDKYISLEMDGTDISIKKPSFFGKRIKELPVFMAGSINNSFDIQPIPLISVANCSVQIYRKEADLANSEFLSCNPTLCITGASNNDDLPNVVGSSVMIVVPNEQARIFYTKTDTAALSHISEHIKDLYEEAIRHGVSILDARKGVEAAEALRIRQATQSASVYSVFLSAITALGNGLKLMCRWAGFDENEVIIDAPSSLTQGIPDSALVKNLSESFGQGIVPLSVIHKYLIDTGLISQNIGFEEYKNLLKTENYEAMTKGGSIEEDLEGEKDKDLSAGLKNIQEGIEDQV